MKEVYSIRNSNDSFSKPTTGSSLSETSNMYHFEKVNYEVMEKEKDPNETISDSEENQDVNEFEENFSNSSFFIKEKDKDKRETKEHGRWTDKEHQRFLEGLVLYGNEWKLVQNHIETRSSTQARSHAQKFFIRMRKKIKNETDSNEIKKKIHRIFLEEMKDKFRTQDLGSFLEKMMRLVLTYDHIPKSSQKKSNTIKIPLYEWQINNAKNSIVVQNDSQATNELSQSYENPFLLHLDKVSPGQTAIVKKEKIFDIKKWPKCKDSVSKRDGPEEIGNLFTSTTKKLVNNSIQAEINPSINYVTINMIDNSSNYFIQNDYQAQIPRKMEAKDTKYDPFKLEFDPIICSPFRNECCDDEDCNIFKTGAQCCDHDESFSAFD